MPEFQPIITLYAELEKALPYPQLFPVFLLIAEQEPIQLSDISKQLELEQFQVSRHVSALGKTYKSNRQHFPGPDLVMTQEDPENRARKIAKLTKKGQKLKVKALEIVKGTGHVKTTKSAKS
jgi:DNA-binding MarR family transcriptional regulator